MVISIKYLGPGCYRSTKNQSARGREGSQGYNDDQVTEQTCTTTTTTSDARWKQLQVPIMTHTCGESNSRGERVHESIFYDKMEKFEFSDDLIPTIVKYLHVNNLVAPGNLPGKGARVMNNVYWFFYTDDNVQIRMSIKDLVDIVVDKVCNRIRFKTMFTGSANNYRSFLNNCKDIVEYIQHRVKKLSIQRKIVVIKIRGTEITQAGLPFYINPM